MADHCWSHWAKWEAFGDPLATRRFYRHPDKLRLLAAVCEDANTGCWNWTRFLDDEGYGFTAFRGGYTKAHRAMYRELVGPIPDGLTLDHLCRNRACVNPEHMEPVTIRVNALRGDTAAARNAARTHCPQDHEYTVDNTYITPEGSRRCRTCTREHIRRSKAKRRRLQNEHLSGGRL